LNRNFWLKEVTTGNRHTDQDLFEHQAIEELGNFLKHD